MSLHSTAHPGAPGRSGIERAFEQLKPYLDKPATLPDSKDQALRFAIAHGYAVGDALVLHNARNSIYGGRKPQFQADAALHWVINDALTGFGGRELVDVMVETSRQSPNEIYVPTIRLTLPKHDRHGNKIMKTEKEQEEHNLKLPLPLAYVRDMLNAARLDQAAALFKSAPAKFPPLFYSEQQDIVRMVAHRMSVRHEFFPDDRWDYGPQQNWLLAEKTVYGALEAPVLGFPKAA